MHRDSGGPVFFKEHKLGLYVHDTTGNRYKSKLNNDCDYMFLNTVTQLESTFTRSEINRAKEVLIYQES